MSIGGGAFTADGALPLKGRPIDENWAAMFSGDAAIAPLVLTRCRSILESEPDEPLSSQTVQEAFRSSLLAEQSQQAVDLVLGPYGLSLEEFRRTGQKIFGDSFWLMRERLEQVSLDLQFLVGGFDDHGHPMIFSVSTPTVSDPAIIKDHSLMGYWAIGSGSYLALSSLAARRHNPKYYTPNALGDVP